MSSGMASGNTDISLGHIHTGMLEQGSDQFDIVMIVYVNVCGEAFRMLISAYIL